ncbi:sulfotransferase family protein [Nocardioides sambongensis]|uniref:sulfotransferase family protein n=1 Tax=Nocardioides sambongensis TaxID=2589074 RepID=UPI00112605F5|nr:sulfotransferase [Nocardioides sambongensis]
MSEPRQRADVGTFEEICAAATRTTGLTDFGFDDEPGHEQAFRLLVEDLGSAEAGLTGTGNYFMRSQVKSALVARLMTQARFAEFPQHAEVAIERPIFVLGLPRTGTTALSRLLCADPHHQGLEMWLTEFPQPRPPRESWEQDPVFSAIQGAFAEHHVSNPEFMGIHYSDAGEPEECWRVLRQTGKSLGFESLAHIPAYSAWLAEQEWTDAYQRHRQNLQLIGLNDQDQRWVLKNPSHLIALDALMEVYPDALVVMTQRDPVTSVASACSLSAEATAGHSTTFVGETLGQDQLGHLTRQWQSFWQARPRYDERQFFDVDYRAFVQDPVGTVGAIYDAFDLTWSEDAQAAVRRLDEESRKGPRRPSHSYDLADYGLSEEQVHRAFDR